MLIEAGRTGQRRAFAAISIGLVALFAVLSHVDGAVLTRYIGELHPILAAALAASVGLACFAVLVPDSGFAVIRTGTTRQGVGIAALVATAFAAVIIVVDTFFVRYPKNINAPFPVALVLYPALGLVVEIIFHVLPLNSALAHPAHIGASYQTRVDGGGTDCGRRYRANVPDRGGATAWIHVFLFNSAQLLTFE